jgi:hypothetical protein
MCGSNFIAFACFYLILTIHHVELDQRTSGESLILMEIIYDVERHKKTTKLHIYFFEKNHILISRRYQLYSTSMHDLVVYIMDYGASFMLQPLISCMVVFFQFC